MAFELHSPEVEVLYPQKNVVFVVTKFSPEDHRVTGDPPFGQTQGAHKGMFVSFEEYGKLLSSHKYNPLLFLSPLHLRVAYLTGCLNREFQNPQNEVYVFWWREAPRVEWRKWFTVRPYRDDPYERPALTDNAFFQR